MCIYIYIYIYTSIHTYIHIHVILLHIYKRQPPRETRVIKEVGGKVLLTEITVAANCSTGNFVR